ncbi:MAG: chalcone isomerase family protein [Pseudomonadota bacterium]
MTHAAALTLTLALLCPGLSLAQATAPLAGLRQAGQGTLRFLGFEIYSAQLWVSPGFDASDYAAQPLVLQLAYQRDFTAEAIAGRSIQEMRRVGRFSPAQAARWQQALQAALPDVKAGDQLTGVYQPGAGAVFQMGGQVVGEVKDPEFSRLFFGIWLSPRTSEPALRQALIAPVGGGSP